MKIIDGLRSAAWMAVAAVLLVPLILSAQGGGQQETLAWEKLYRSCCSVCYGERGSEEASRRRPWDFLLTVEEDKIIRAIMYVHAPDTVNNPRREKHAIWHFISMSFQTA